jgi:heme-degrading monooxygenase HmoA
MYVIVWRFVANDPAEFERHYGPAGTWVAFFRQDPAFLRTELLRGEAGEYLTLDYWVSEEAFLAFRAANLADYEAIDRRCETLTEREERIGGYVITPGAPPA